MRLQRRRSPEVRELREGVFVLEVPGTRRRPAEELGVVVRDGATWTGIGPAGVLAEVHSFQEAVAALER